MGKAKEIKLEELVVKIGHDLNRSEHDIQKECDKLKKHWIVTLYDWLSLSEERRNLVGLPVMLNTKLEQLISIQSLEIETKEDICYIIQRNSKSITILIKQEIFEFYLKDTIQQYQSTFGKECYFQTPEKIELPVDTMMTYAIVPGNRLFFRNTIYILYSSYELTAIDNWLYDLNMMKYTNQFKANDLEDFLTLPFIKIEALEAMGIYDENDQNLMYNAIQEILDYSKSQFVGVWLKYLGFDQAPQLCVENQIDLYNLLLVKDAKYFENIGFEVDVSEKLWQIVEKYKKFSSVEETFEWLRANNFDKYSFHFARYNIPFYALPFVNFFIINEMGVTIDDQQLLSALQELKDSPTYNAKAVTFWLRDLEMETYNLSFAKNKFCCLENYTTLDDRSLDKFIDNIQDKDRMKTGIREMKEFQFYYTATSSLLQELGMEKYSQLFALHGISIDVLPLLTEPQLIEMGITKVADRKRILSVIQKIKDFIPSNDDASDRMKARKQIANNNYAAKRSQNLITNNNNSNNAATEDTRSVEEWLSFINDGSRPVVIKKTENKASKKSSKKKKKKTKKTKAKNNATPANNNQNSSDKNITKIEDIEKEIVNHLEKSNIKKKANQPNQSTPKSPNLKPSSPNLKPANNNTKSPNLKPSQPPSSSPLPSSPSSARAKSFPLSPPPVNAKPLLTTETSLPISDPPSPLVDPIKSFSSQPIDIPQKIMDSPIGKDAESPTALEKDFFSLDENANDDEMDPEIMAMLDAEVEEFRKRLESASTKSKLVPLFYLPE